MKLLLDTHALLWFLADDPRLSASAKKAIEDPANERWLSGISLLEIAIKLSINKLRLPAPFTAMFPGQLILNRISLIAIEAHHAAGVASLPLHHRDPFDRLLAATALADGFALVSADIAFDAYGLARVW
jgi:PIN domain nuclease of toxin-antitoxin system